jgi:hypothetical protein
MAELQVADVVAFTHGRLADDSDTKKTLDAALIAARREVGWHVSPIRVDDVLILDGPWSRILQLPTRKIIALTEIKENGTVLPLSTLNWSIGDTNNYGPGRAAVVRKLSQACWSGDYGSIEVTMTHGYTEAQAADWRQAVLSMVDQMSLLPVSAGASRSSADMTGKQIDDVEYRWGFGIMGLAEQALFSVSHILANYRIQPVEFM